MKLSLPGEFHLILTNPGTDVKTRYDVMAMVYPKLIELSPNLRLPSPVRKYQLVSLWQ